MAGNYSPLFSGNFSKPFDTKPKARYSILGIARVSHWKDGVFQLDGFAPDGSLFSQSIDGPLAKDLQEIEIHVDPYDPRSQQDARQRVLSSVVRRRGQGKFRANLLRAYGGKCAISGCNIEAVLEAAHVTPYLGPETNTMSNGILLRADLHTLWDLGLIAIDPISKQLWISPSLHSSEYAQYQGIVPFNPNNQIDKIAYPALQQHWKQATS
ncbi:MAG: HNH endonuclease [Bacteroidetes bacterium]|nr:HNH endonuclease [Bacteroidota bacterium]